MSKKIKKANTGFFRLLRFLVPILRHKYGYKLNMKSAKGIKRPCLILSNHQTSFDQFSVLSLFKFGINVVASDSLFRHGLLSRFMKVLARPIPFNKGSSDAAAVKNIFSVIRDGGSVLMFPTGNRSFFGEECTLKPGLGKLAKKLGVQVVLVKMRGGYNVKPRWKMRPNKGKMSLGVDRVITPEELSGLSADEIEAVIQKELYFNEFEWNRQEQNVYKGKRKAEGLEHVLFYCPGCHSLCKLKSKRDEFFCIDCGMRVKINPTGFFEKSSNADKCPDTILEWGKIQLDYIKQFDYTPYADKSLFLDNNVRFYKAVRSTRDELIGKGTISLNASGLTICGKEFPVATVKDIAVQSYNRLMLYTDEGEFTVDLPKLSSAVKYMITSYHLKNTAFNIHGGHYGF